jgi:hypothetical protein
MHAVLEQVFDLYRAELSDKSAEWCQLHPQQDERLWSAQELIEHLVLTCRSSSRVMQKRFDRGQPTSERSTPVQWLLQMIMLSFGQMPNGVPAPVFARPDQLHWPPTTGPELLEMLRKEIDEMDSLIDRCKHSFGIQRIAPHFLLGPLRADQWRRFHVIHIRHHLGQLRRLEQTVGHPVAQEVPAAQA